MDRAAEDFVERMGLHTEADGLSRIAGRLFGALILAEEPRSLDDLAESLGVSKASASVEGRRLLERGVVERVSRPGDRRDYYTLAPDFFERVIRRRVARWSSLHALVSGMRGAAPPRSPVVRERFAHLDEFHTFVVARLEDALAEWSEREAREQRVARPRGRTAAARRKPVAERR